jgi:hypothetical protein
VVGLNVLAETQEEVSMTTSQGSEQHDGVYLRELEKGSVIVVETESRPYRMEYLGEDDVRISGHPNYCPTPVVAHVSGSLSDTGAFEPGFVGRGMHLVFRRDDSQAAVSTSKIADIKLAA